MPLYRAGMSGSGTGRGGPVAEGGAMFDVAWGVVPQPSAGSSRRTSVTLPSASTRCPLPSSRSVAAERRWWASASSASWQGCSPSSVRSCWSPGSWTCGAARRRRTVCLRSPPGSSWRKPRSSQPSCGGCGGVRVCCAVSGWPSGLLRRAAIAGLTASLVAFTVCFGFGRGGWVLLSWLAGGLCGLALLLGDRTGEEPDAEAVS